MTFENLMLDEAILRALQNEGYSKPTPIQERAIPIILEQRDLLGCAQTGTGKTAAFSIPIIQLLRKERSTRNIRSLILTPTRELAIQIGESLAAYGKFAGLKHTVVFGGVSQLPQVEAVRKGVDVLVATPGRLLDLINQGIVHLNAIEIFVLDEADRMLDMGFIHDVKRVIAYLPKKRQTLFFSATMPAEIQKLASSILNNPARVEVTPVSSTAETIKQSLYYVDYPNKKALLIDLLQDDSIQSALVFTRTKYGADKVTRFLAKAKIKAEAMHGEKSQQARQRALGNFKSGQTRVLVATDIAARGIDVDDLSHVINYEIPNIPETYVHRIGRTGRAGAKGIAISFCNFEEKEYIKDIQKLTGVKIPVVEEHAYPMQMNEPGPKKDKSTGRQKAGSPRPNNGSNNKRAFRHR